MGTHPNRRASNIRPVYSGAASRPKPSGPHYVTLKDAEILCVLFGFRTAEEFLEFAEQQQAKANGLQ